MGLVDNQTANEYSQFVFKSCLKNDSVMLRYLQENENVTAEKLESFHNFFNVLKNKRALIEIGKSVIKSVMCNTKKAVLSSAERDERRSKLVNRIFRIVHPLFKFIEPENIETKLTEDEYLALISDMVKKDKKYQSVNVYLVIGTNMLMSLVSNNLAGLISNTKDGNILSAFTGAGNTSEKPHEISDELIDSLYKKVIVTSNVDVEDSASKDMAEKNDQIDSPALDDDSPLSPLPAAEGYQTPSPNSRPPVPPLILKRKRSAAKHSKSDTPDAKRSRRKLTFDEAKTEYYDDDDEDSESEDEWVAENNMEKVAETQVEAEMPHCAKQDFATNGATFDISSIFQEIGETQEHAHEKNNVEESEEDVDVDDDQGSEIEEIEEEGSAKESEEEELELSDVTGNSGTLITKEENLQLSGKKTASISKMLELFKTKGDVKYSSGSNNAATFE